MGSLERETGGGESGGREVGKGEGGRVNRRKVR